MTSNERRGVCAHCNAEFTVPVRRGPAPTYCRPAHRQRALEARQRAELRSLRAAAVAAPVVTTPPAPPAAATPPPAPPAALSTRRRPWVAVQVRPDGSDRRVLSGHTTERAASRAAHRAFLLYGQQNGTNAAYRWTWRAEARGA